MKVDLPLRHRVALAVLLFLVALVAGTWVSTFIGERQPSAWGVAIGLFVGAVLAVEVLSHRRFAAGPPRQGEGTGL
jgi:hypothetical protein